MSFGQFNKQKLLEIAEYFQVDADESQTKAEIEASIKLAGISWAAYKKFEAEREQVDTETTMFADSRILLKMDRQNPTFETHGVTFTKENPFVLLDANTAQEIIDAHEGFRVATPSEVRSFYS